MKNLYFLMLFLPKIFFAQQPNLGIRFYNSINDINNISVNERLVSSDAFDSIAFKLISKTVPDISSKIKSGNNFGVSFAEDKTEATGQIAFSGRYGIVSVGLRATLEEKLFEVYNSKDEFGNDWGLNASWSYNLPSTTYLKYYSADRPEYIHKRNAFANKLKGNEREILYQFAGIRNYEELLHYKAIVFPGLKDSLNNYQNDLDNPYEYSNYEVNLRRLNRLQSIVLELEVIFGENLENIPPVNLVDTIDNYIESKFISFETKNHIFSGYQFWQIMLQGSYNNKSYKTYNDSDADVNSRFKDLVFDNGYNISLGLNFYYSKKRVFVNLNNSIGFKNINSFDDLANKKYNKSYTNDFIKGKVDSINLTQSETNSKSAFDLRMVQYKLYNTCNLPINRTVCKYTISNLV